MSEVSPGWLERWRRWDRFSGGRPFHRPEVDRLVEQLEHGESCMIRGSRGTGKSTLLRLAATRLVERGWPRSAIVSLDLEDPVWAPGPTARQVDDLLASVSGGARLLLLDGVERLVGFDAWVDASHARTAGQVLAARTGSTVTSVPKGLAILDCLPLGFAPWMRQLAERRQDDAGAREALIGYLKAGGLPVARQPQALRQALLELFGRSLMMDVLMAAEVRDPHVLTAMAVEMICRTGRVTSASRWKGQLTRSVDQARMFLTHLQAAGLVDLVVRIEDAEREAAQASRLCFAADTGLAWALLERGETQAGSEAVLERLAFTSVYLQLKRKGSQIHAWRQRERLGLAVGTARSPDRLIDVQFQLEGKPDPRPLSRAMQRFGCSEGLLLIGVQPPTSAISAGLPDGIRLQPLWEWLQDDVLTDTPVDNIMTDKKVDSVGRLPTHLL